jgi:hypothetical protein
MHSSLGSWGRWTTFLPSSPFQYCIDGKMCLCSFLHPNHQSIPHHRKPHRHLASYSLPSHPQSQPNSLSGCCVTSKPYFPLHYLNSTTYARQYLPDKQLLPTTLATSKIDSGNIFQIHMPYCYCFFSQLWYVVPFATSASEAALPKSQSSNFSGKAATTLAVLDR